MIAIGRLVAARCSAWRWRRRSRRRPCARGGTPRPTVHLRERVIDRLPGLRGDRREQLMRDPFEDLFSAVAVDRLVSRFQIPPDSRLDHVRSPHHGRDQAARLAAAVPPRPLRSVMSTWIDDAPITSPDVPYIGDEPVSRDIKPRRRPAREPRIGAPYAPQVLSRARTRSRLACVHRARGRICRHADTHDMPADQISLAVHP